MVDDLIARNDRRTTQEEADILRAQQMVVAAREQTHFIKVICDEWDILILLIYMYNVCGLNSRVIMEGSSSQRTVTDIKDAMDKYGKIIT